MALGATGYNELVSTTLASYSDRQLVDNVMTLHPLLDALKSVAKSDTGTQVQVPVRLGTAANTNWTDDSGTFALTASGEIAGTAVYPWSGFLVSTVRINAKTVKMNKGAKQIVNIVSAHVDDAYDDHAKKLALAFHALPGSSAPPGAGGRPESLASLISDTITVGGINPSTQPRWKASVLTSSKADTPDIKKAMRILTDTIYVNSDGARADWIFAGFDVFEELYDSLDANTRYNMGSGQTVQETRWREIQYMGVTVRLDPDCPADRMYFVDSKSIEMRYLDGTFLEKQEDQVVTGTLESITPLASIVCLLVKKRRNNGLLIRTA